MSATSERSHEGLPSGLDLADPNVQAALIQAREMATAFKAGSATLDPVYRLGAAASRRRRQEGGGVLGPPVLLDHAQTEVVTGRSGDIPIRILTPPVVDGVYLHIHGGGWVLGGASEQDDFLWELACESNAVVVSIEYRLAPEHPFPAAADDCEDVAIWLSENTKSRFNTDRLFIGGESAGAHLCVMTLLRLRERAAAQSVSGASFIGADLSYGVFDLSMTPSQLSWGDEELVISTPTMAWFYECFVPDASIRRTSEVSPLYADLRSLPPALFSVGTQDPLLDDTLFMAARWQAAGSDALLRVYPEGMHGFTMFPHDLATLANAERYQFIKHGFNEQGKA